MIQKNDDIHQLIIHKAHFSFSRMEIRLSYLHMGSSNSKSSNESRASLNDSRHSLNNTFDPEFDWEMWFNTLQGGNTIGAKSLKRSLIIKYASYPELSKRFNALPERPYSVPNLGALNAFHGLQYRLDPIDEADGSLDFLR